MCVPPVRLNYHKCRLATLYKLNCNFNYTALFYSSKMAESSTNLRQKSSILDGPRKFYKDSVLFIHRCTKPDRRGTIIN